MSFRRSVLGLVGAAAIALAACSTTGSSASPGASGVTLPNPASLNPASITAGLEGFCADFASKLVAKWPNIDASTAASLGPVVQQWAGKTELAPVQADVTKIGAWVTASATAGSVSTPPPDVTTSFNNLKAFADANC
jgi:hypothetical protein